MPVHLLRYLMFDTGAECCRIIRPAEDLRAVIDSFVVVNSGDACTRCLALSDGMPSMIVAFRCGDDLRAEETSPDSAWITSPMLNGIYMERLAADSSFLIVRFNIETFHRLIGKPLKDLRARKAWRLPELLGSKAIPLENALRLSKGPEGKLACIEGFFRAMPLPALRHNTVLRAALEEIRKSGGCISIRALSRALGVNYKFLERSFVMRLGVSPKEYARFQRFIRAYFNLVSTRGTDVLSTALDGGYCDQNHFAKDFKWFTGRSPVSYLKTLTRDFGVHMEQHVRKV